MSSAEFLGKKMAPRAWRQLWCMARKSLIYKEKDAAKIFSKKRFAAKAATLASSWRHLSLNEKNPMKSTGYKNSSWRQSWRQLGGTNMTPIRQSLKIGGGWRKPLASMVFEVPVPVDNFDRTITMM